MKIKQVILTIFILFQIAFFSSEPSEAQIGGYAGSYLRMGVGTRAQGMGNSYVAVANDVTAGYWNPAGLGYLETIQFSLAWTSVSLDRRFNYLAIAIPAWPRGMFSVSWFNYHLGDIERRDETSFLVGTFSNSESAFLFSYGVSWKKYFSLGATAKVLVHDLGEYRATGTGYDFGFQIKPSQVITIGATVQNLNAAIKWNYSKDKLPQISRIGVSYRPLWNLNLSIDYEYFNLPGRDWSFMKGQYHKWHVGGEYLFKKLVTLRAGIDDNRFTMGFSLPVLRMKQTLEFGYGFANDPLSQSYVHKVGILLKLDKPYNQHDYYERIPGDQMVAGKILGINENLIQLDLGQWHGLKSEMKVTIYKEEQYDISSILIKCSGDIVEINNNNSIIKISDEEFLSNLFVGRKVVVVF